MQNSVVDFLKPALRIETQLSVSKGDDVIVCPKEGLQQMRQRAYLLAPRLDHATCGVPYWRHNLKGTLPSWSSPRKPWRLGSNGERIRRWELETARLHILSPLLWQILRCAHLFLLSSAQ